MHDINLNLAGSASSQTTVVNVKHGPCDVYIGRACGNFAGSIFANPYKIGEHGTRAEVLERYRGYAEKRRDEPEFSAALEALRGKRIGCWCKPFDCHGDILRALLGESTGAPPAAQASLF